MNRSVLGILPIQKLRNHRRQVNYSINSRLLRAIQNLDPSENKKTTFRNVRKKKSSATFAFIPTTTLPRPPLPMITNLNELMPITTLLSFLPLKQNLLPFRLLAKTFIHFWSILEKLLPVIQLSVFSHRQQSSSVPRDLLYSYTGSSA